MTDYSNMDHQQLYDYVQSGDPNAMNHTAQAWANHAAAIQDATHGLQTNLTAIQSQWHGAAADAYFQQSQDVAQKMQTHADNANATSTAVGNTASALSWARNNMPQPPSWLEQETAKIDSNFATGAIGFALGGPGVTVASEMAKHDIEQKHQQAISTMTQLAGAYTAAQQQLPSSTGHGSFDDPGNGNNNGNNPGGPGATPMPVPVYPVGGTPIGGSPVSVGHGGGGYGGGGHGSGGGGYGGGGFGGGSGGAGGGSGRGLHDPIPAFHDPGGTSTQGTSFGAGGTSGSLYGGTGMGGNPGSTFGGGGAGGLGEAGLGAAGLGGLGGAAGMGGFGGKAGGTGLGGGEGSGIGAEGGASETSGSGSPYGAAARAAAGVAGEGEAGAEGQQGMMGGGMGGMGGRGGAGGSGEERGNRAGFLRQDPDYWYGDKKAAPPGGVIE
jgi:WXG100 family type VII secretion target